MEDNGIKIHYFQFGKYDLILAILFSTLPVTGKVYHLQTMFARESINKTQKDNKTANWSLFEDVREVSF